MWALVDKTLTQNGYTRSDIDIVWYFNAWAFQEVPDIDVYINLMRDSLQVTMNSINTLYPNAQLIYLTSREYGGYADDTLNPEPKPYRDGFAVQELIATRIASPGDGIPILWQAYQWEPAWTADYFTVDGVHLSPIGLDAASDLWLNFFVGEPWLDNGSPAPTATPTSVPVDTATPGVATATSTPEATVGATATPNSCPP